MTATQEARQASRRAHLARAQVGFFVVAFLGFLVFGDRLGATNVGKHVRTGVQVPAVAQMQSSSLPAEFLRRWL
jgi:hypothetical protein